MSTYFEIINDEVGRRVIVARDYPDFKKDGFPQFCFANFLDAKRELIQIYRREIQEMKRLVYSVRKLKKNQVVGGSK